MKKSLIIMLTIGLLSLSDAYSQTVNDVLIKDIDVQYIQIIGTSKPTSKFVTVELDFGQSDKAFSSRDTQVKDANGKFVKFNSMIDALNFFSQYGYKLVNAYALTTEDQIVHHYILEKKKE